MLEPYSWPIVFKNCFFFNLRSNCFANGPPSGRPTIAWSCRTKCSWSMRHTETVWPAHCLAIKERPPLIWMVSSHTMLQMLRPSPLLFPFRANRFWSNRSASTILHLVNIPFHLTCLSLELQQLILASSFFFLLLKVVYTINRFLNAPFHSISHPLYSIYKYINIIYIPSNQIPPSPFKILFCEFYI